MNKSDLLFDLPIILALIILLFWTLWAHPSEECASISFEGSSTLRIDIVPGGLTDLKVCKGPQDCVYASFAGIYEEGRKIREWVGKKK